MKRYEMKESDTGIMPNISNTRKSFAYVMTMLAVLFAIVSVVFIVCFAVYYNRYVECDTKPPPSPPPPTPTPSPDWKKNFIAETPLETFDYNAIACDSAVCGVIATNIMNVLGGNAMDAAVAAMFCLGIHNYHSNGIGGGSFTMFYNRSAEKMTAYNYRERAPFKANETMFTGNLSLYGGLAIGVPGDVMGLYLAQKEQGRLQWKVLLQPSIDILKSGSKVNQAIAKAISDKYPNIPNSYPYKELRDFLTNPATAKPYVFGETIYNPKLLTTFQTIQNDPFAFYNGSLALDIVQEINDAGGFFTIDDLKNYTVSKPNPVIVNLPHYNLTLGALPPPSSGVLIGVILNILGTFKMTPNVKNSFNDYVNFLHRVTEAYKFAFAKRSEFGDNNFVNNTALLDNITSIQFAEEIKTLITDAKTHSVPYYRPNFRYSNDAGTTHLAIVDSDGNAVSTTSTINTYFGSMVKGNKTGIIYNNEMDDFSRPGAANFFGILPSPSNYIVPGKRPMSSMSPVILLNNKKDVQHVIGGAGGTKIITAVSYVLARVLILGENIKEAMDSYRFHNQLIPSEIQYAPPYSPMPQEIVDALKSKGHNFTTSLFFGSVIEAVARIGNTNKWNAYTDFRKPSMANGI